MVQERPATQFISPIMMAGPTTVKSLAKTSDAPGVLQTEESLERLPLTFGKKGHQHNW
jgi:hypothetical protein